MTPTTRLLTILATAALLLAGCDNSGVLLGPAGVGLYDIDSSGVGDGQLLTPYQGVLQVRGYDGPAAWTVTGGELPAGLGMQGNGTVSGTPTWVGHSTFTVSVSLGGSSTLTGEVGLRITPGDTQVHLGWTRDQTTRLTNSQGLMLDMWVRAVGGGEEMSKYTLDPGVYTVGTNGVAEAGAGDDVRVGDLSAAEVGITLGEWQVLSQWDHIPDESPPTFDGGLTFQAGADTGEVAVTVNSEYGAEETRLMVVPPDWCPQGQDGFDGWCL